MTNLQQYLQDREEDLQIKLYNFGRMSDSQELADAQEDIEEIINETLQTALKMQAEEICKEIDNINNYNCDVWTRERILSIIENYK